MSAFHLKDGSIIFKEKEVNNILRIPFFQPKILNKAWVLSGVLWRDDFTDEARQGAINAVKGKYFELWGAEFLKDVLPCGYSAELADSKVQKGWDLKILNAHKKTTDFLQAKATSCTAYVYESLLRYPQFRVLTTHEVAKKMRPKKFNKTEFVWDSGMLNADLGEWIAEEFSKKY